MPKYHFRVETNYYGPHLIEAKSWHDLLDKIKVWSGQTMPARLSVEFLSVIELPEEADRA